MLPVQRPIICLATCLCIGLLSSCANSPTGKALERTFAADSKLKNNANVVSTTNTAQNQTVALPEDFPTEIPLYPQAQLQKVAALDVPSAQGQLTNWTTSDPINAVQSFYQRAFNSGSWQVISKPDTDAGGTFVVRRNNLQVTLSLSTGTTTQAATPSPTTPSQTGAIATKFDIQYIRNAGETTSQQPATPTATPTTAEIVTGTPQNFTDLDKLPQGLRQHIDDLAALGVLSIDASKAKNDDTVSNNFEPNKTISRREFARWLVAANNRIYANRPGQQIRLASDSAKPAFQDVAKSNPDFASIQALAEAGLIPSPLSGDTTAVLFRPDAPLTRENLILWKIPLDTRQALPTASVDAVKQTWGFQDAGKMDSKALRAVVADFQNGDQSNIRRVLGYTTLFQPKKAVTRAEAAETIWFFGSQTEGISAKEALQLKPQKSQPVATPEATPTSDAN
ncbi:MAG: S-layer homology domain-containing protein [Coleofasciculaceae cyanobacterium]